MKCPHYDLEEVNLVLDGITPPILECKKCGKEFRNMKEVLIDRYRKKVIEE